MCMLGATFKSMCTGDSSAVSETVKKKILSAMRTTVYEMCEREKEISLLNLV